MKSKIFLLFLVLFLFSTILVWSRINYSLEATSSPSIIGNSVIEIVYDGKYIWVATGDGLSGTSDGGENWNNFDSRTGLNSDEISALAVQYRNSDTILWVACSHTELLEGALIPFGDGFNKSTNFGTTWASYKPSQATWPGMLAYDLAVVDSSVWAACFYGGLIMSRDGGATWKNVFVDSIAKDDFENGYFNDYRNRFFSVTADTSSNTTFIWEGQPRGFSNSFTLLQIVLTQ